MQGGSVTRIRLLDVPPRRVHKYEGEVRKALANLEAGLGPQEAIEIDFNGAPVSAASSTLAKVRKEIKAKKYAADAFTAMKDGHRRIYIIGL